MTLSKVNDEEFIEAVKTNYSIAGVLKQLGLVAAGGAYYTFKVRVKRLELDTSHFTGQGHLKGKTHKWNNTTPLEKILVEDCSYQSPKLRTRLIKEGLLKNECSKCGHTGMWQGQELTLHLDHINGDHFDNRLENLRLLCPNCHSQTPTYCSKNQRKNQNILPRVKVQYLCKYCSKQLNRKGAQMCTECYHLHMKELKQQNPSPTKIVWPDHATLSREVELYGHKEVAKRLGVCTKSIQNHLKKGW